MMEGPFTHRKGFSISMGKLAFWTAMLGTAAIFPILIAYANAYGWDSRLSFRAPWGIAFAIDIAITLIADVVILVQAARSRSRKARR